MNRDQEEPTAREQSEASLQPEAPQRRGLWREWLRPFLVIVIGMLSFRSAVADWNHVPTGSMKPSILVGDRIFVNKMAYDLRLPFTRVRLAEWSEPERGDVVVFLSPKDGKRLVKRVIGLAGDVIAMRSNRVLVNGEPAIYAPLAKDLVAQLEAVEGLDHSFATETLIGEERAHPIMTSPMLPSVSSFGPLEVPPGHLFVLGDNRDDSSDSRAFGFVDKNRILGQATAIALSVDPERRYRPRWERFFSALH